MRYQAPPQQPADLQQQAIHLAQQLAGLKAQRIMVERQLRSSKLDGSLRQELLQQHANLVEQISQAETELTSVRGQLAPVANVPPPQIINNPRQADPEMVIGLSFALAMIFAIPLSIAWAKRIWRGGKVQVVGPKMDEISPRLDRLEQAVDAIAIEIERISEGQRFVTKVLVDRPQQAAKADESAAPILALGAGPAEPIRKAERQTVRPSVTPH